MSPDFQATGRRALRVNAPEVRHEAGKKRWILLAIQEVPERGRRIGVKVARAEGRRWTERARPASP